jgi:DNA primase
MPRRYSPELLRALRNDIAIAGLIAQVLDWPWKISEGQFRFLCPLCGEFNSATNPRTNLARCFGCQQNFNPIDLVMAVRRCTFVEAVQLLKSTTATPVAAPQGTAADALPSVK